MHIITLVHTDSVNHKKFVKWINSRDYGSRPFCREFRFYDIAIQEVHKDRLLADLKHYHKENLTGGTKTKKIKKVIDWLFKIMKLKPVSFEGIEKTPSKWFTPINFNGKEACTHAVYLEVIGGLSDTFDKYGHEEI